MRLIGVPVKGTQPTIFFSNLLVDILGKDVLSSPPELDRAHRELRPKPAGGDKPRAMIICFHKFQTKDMIIRAARKKQDDLKYDGNSVYLYDDYCPEVTNQQVQYKEVMRQLFTLKLKPARQYPMALFIKADDGERQCLFSVKEAQQFLASHQKSGSLVAHGH